jgi:succinate dehydrogenase/fumarate reductase cytochrome b subunit
LSGLHRITGAAIGGGKFILFQHSHEKKKKKEIEIRVLILYRVTLRLGFYLGALAYVAAPLAGISIDGASIVAAAAGAPVAAKVALKATVAFPFVFHCLNGVRHLVRN